MRPDLPLSSPRIEAIREHAAFGSAFTTIADLNGIVKLITCGSVDDGKSTLIGRLLWDASPLYDDQRERLLKESATLNGTKRPDFSRLGDGLIAEQEQGITIDIAWHFFDTASKRFIIIDAPGHEQYTRNMATGASHADVAVLLVDAQSGIKLQTRRHLAILDLVGVRNVILAVNKMDLIAWDEVRFNTIAAEFHALADRFPTLKSIAIPVSAIGGDNIAAHSLNMSWHRGPTLLEYLDSVAAWDERDRNAEHFRMPVQLVLRDGKGFRGLAGTVTAGSVRVGDEVLEARTGLKSQVKRIQTMDGDREIAQRGNAVAIEFTDDVDVGRGGLLTAPSKPPLVTRSLNIRLVWLGNQNYSPSTVYMLRIGTDAAPVTALEIKERLNLDTFEHQGAETCEPNSISIGRLELARPVAIDLFAEQPETGAFMLVEALTGAVVAGGVVTGAETDKIATTAKSTFILSRDLLSHGLCADLTDANDEIEFFRRANEVAILIRAAGISVEIE